jgi:hypothetical protein
MAYRINERNIGDHKLEGSVKTRRNAKAKLSEQEIELAKAVLQRVYECLQFDKNLSKRGHLHDDSIWSDGGRFIISLTGKQKNNLFDIIHERKF